MGDRVAVLRDGVAAAVRDAAGAVHPTGQRVRRRLHRLTGDEPAAGAARRRGGGGRIAERAAHPSAAGRARILSGSSIGVRPEGLHDRHRRRARRDGRPGRGARVRVLPLLHRGGRRRPRRSSCAPKGSARRRAGDAVSLVPTITERAPLRRRERQASPGELSRRCSRLVSIPVLGTVVHVVGARQARPNLPSAGCPFCVGGLEAPERVRRAVVPQPMAGDGRRALRSRALHAGPTTPASRRSALDEARKVIDLWAERTDAARGRDDVDYVLVFENSGAEVGATIAHPHGQIYAYDHVPSRQARRLAGGWAPVDGPTTPRSASGPSSRRTAGGRGCRSRRRSRSRSRSPRSS